MIFKLKHKTFGLDIGEQTLKIVQLKKVKNKAQILTLGSITVPNGVIQNGKIVKIDEFSRLIKELHKKCQGKKILTHYATVSLPEPKTFIKLISLTYPENKNILEEIINESTKHIPYPLEKTYLDWQYVDQKDKTNVLIAVCLKEIVINYQDALTKAGLIPTALEIEAAAICRCLIEYNKPVIAPLFILDLGATRTSLIAYQNQTVLFSLSLTFSSDYLTKKITDKLKLSYQEADKAKRICGLNPDKAEGGVKKILESLVDDLARQIREAKYFYHEHFSKENEINQLILTGGGSQLPYLIDYLEKKCQLKISVGDPLINLIKPKPNLLPTDLQSYTTALGLALRDIQKY
jgi:type IV pilus assembly protein PilM